MADRDFQSFKNSFKGDLITASDPGYDAAINRWAHNAARPAKVVAFVKDTGDISAAIKYAKASGLPLAIRGGGHSTAGTSSSENGLVIDLSKYLNGVKIDADNKLGYVGGGAIWQTVDEAAIAHGLATVGGTVNHTGVGGLITGGGYGWLSAQYGLAIDNLVQATVVIADGSVLTVSPAEHPDLFWGIRGGGSNFGVVSEFVLQLHPQTPKVFAGHLIFPGDKCDSVAAALDVWWPKVSDKEGLLAVMTLGPDGNPCVVLAVYYNGSEKDGRERFKIFLDLGPVMDLATEIPYEKLNSLQNHLAEYGLNYFMKGTLQSITPSKDLNSTHLKKVAALSKEHNLAISLIVECFPHGIINSIPADWTPYGRNLAGNCLIIIQWKDNAPEINKVARDVAHTLSDMLPEGEPYGNYASGSEALPTGKEPIDRVRTYFDINYPRLQQIKKKYDPDLLFNKWFVITPA